MNEVTGFRVGMECRRAGTGRAWAEWFGQPNSTSQVTQVPAPG